jgi:ParB family chromosome partitioning protein
MAARKGLGRGLDALLDPYMEENTEKKTGVQEVDVRLIDTNAQQPRKQFEEEALKELAASIRQHGIVQPLIVKEQNGRYLIVAGERRFRAARMAKLETVPVLTVDYDEAKIHEVALIENIQREDLNPIEEATAIRFLMQQHDMTQEEVAERIGKSRPAVANALRLLQLPQPVLALVREGTISAGHGRAIAGIADAATQQKIADECVRLGYSVRALESRIKNLDADKPKKVKKAQPALTPVLSDLEEGFRERLGTKVKIAGSEKRGKITIEYFSEDDLQRIYEVLNG